MTSILQACILKNRGCPDATGTSAARDKHSPDAGSRSCYQWRLETRWIGRLEREAEHDIDMISGERMNANVE